MGEIVPLFTTLGSSAGILHEIRKHTHENPDTEMPFGQTMKGGLLGAAVGAVADIVIQTATRRRRPAARGSGRAGQPPQRSGRTGGGGLAAADIQGSPSGLMPSRRSSGKSGNRYPD